MSDQRLGLRLRAGVLALALAQQLAVGQRGRGREAGGHLREARHVLIRAVNAPSRRSFRVFREGAPARAFSLYARRRP